MYVLQNVEEVFKQDLEPRDEEPGSSRALRPHDRDIATKSKDRHPVDAVGRSIIVERKGRSSGI